MTLKLQKNVDKLISKYRLSIIIRGNIDALGVYRQLLHFAFIDYSLLSRFATFHRKILFLVDNELGALA